MPKVLVAALLLTVAHTAGADTIFVPGDYSAISLALANASPGDVVYVTGGPYLEWNLSIPPNVSVIAPGFGSVQINALEQGGIFSLSAENASYVIEGFTLTGGHPIEGAVVYTGHANVDLDIRRCVFRDNSATETAGAIICYGGGSSVRIEYCSFLNNTAAFKAGAIFMDGQVAGSTLYIANSAFVGNTAREDNGGALYLNSRVEAYFDNVFIEDNSSVGNGGGLYAKDWCDLEFHSCLFSGNEGNTGDDFRIADTNVRVYYSDFVGGWNEVEGASSLALICCGFLAGADPSTWGPGVFVYNDGCLPTGVSADGDVPRITPTLTCYPNPFNPRVTIEYAVASDGPIDLAIYSVDGRRVCQLESGQVPAGGYATSWNGLDDAGLAVPAGTYFCRLATAKGAETRKMELIR